MSIEDEHEDLRNLLRSADLSRRANTTENTASLRTGNTRQGFSSELNELADMIGSIEAATQKGERGLSSRTGSSQSLKSTTLKSTTTSSLKQTVIPNTTSRKTEVSHPLRFLLYSLLIISGNNSGK